MVSFTSSLQLSSSDEQFWVKSLDRTACSSLSARLPLFLVELVIQRLFLQGLNKLRSWLIPLAEYSLRDRVFLSFGSFRFLTETCLNPTSWRPTDIENSICLSLGKTPLPLETTRVLFDWQSYRLEVYVWSSNHRCAATSIMLFFYKESFFAH